MLPSAVCVHTSKIGNEAAHIIVLGAAGTVSSGSRSDSPDVASVMESLLGPRGPKPKTERLMAVYWDVHKDRLQPLYQTSKSISGPLRISDWNTFLLNAWAEESVEVQQAVKDEQGKRHSIAIDKWSASGSQPLDVETQRR